MNDGPVSFSRRRSALLAFAAAYVDTCGFIGMFGLFASHVTGNFVLIGAELVNQHHASLTKLLALPVFIGSVILTAQAEIMLRRRSAHALGWLLGLQALLIAAAAVLFRVVGEPAHADDLPTYTIGLLLVCAMGVQNALMRTSLAGAVQTTVMTGNVAQISIDLLGLVTGRADAATRSRLRRSWPAIMGFALGCTLGAAAYAWLRFDCLWLAALFVVAAAV